MYLMQSLNINKTCPLDTPTLLGCCYLLLQGTVKDEDEHALEGVECGEEVRHDYCVFVDKEKPEGPSEAEQEEQGNGPQSPGSRGDRQVNMSYNDHLF